MTRRMRKKVERRRIGKEKRTIKTKENYEDN
jgi:hypothetical protein